MKNLFKSRFSLFSPVIFSMILFNQKSSIPSMAAAVLSSHFHETGKGGKLQVLTLCRAPYRTLGKGKLVTT